VVDGSAGGGYGADMDAPATGRIVWVCAPTAGDGLEGVAGCVANGVLGSSVVAEEVDRGWRGECGRCSLHKGAVEVE
jgi:hypothetical protein